MKIVEKRGTLSNSTITGWEDTDPEAAADAWSQTRVLPIIWGTGRSRHMVLAECYPVRQGHLNLFHIVILGIELGRVLPSMRRAKFLLPLLAVVARFGQTRGYRVTLV